MSFTGQTVANIWGYAADGHEYALIGAAKGLIIADITNPDAPQQIVQIPGPNNLWKEIKTYGHFAYVVSEGGQGIQVVDLSNLPSANLSNHFYAGDGAILGQLGKIHALHIDLRKGYLYAYGGNLFNGGAKIFDLKPDPYNPVYMGKFDQLGYVHDGYVDNDTMWAAHIYQGLFSVVNMTEKTTPALITSQNTPNTFTHNTWLSDDRRTLFTTDEVNNSFLAAFDVSDLDNITLLDKIQSNPGSNSMVHNTYILNNYAITSWYKDGFTIVDVTRPDNLVQVGNYDVYPNVAGGGSEGCWGVYPYFPSGNIIASVINAPNTSNGELWILTPEYVRACFLEGTVVNGLTGTPLIGVQVDVLGTAPLSRATTLADGTFKMGQEQTGYFVVRASKTGFQAQEYTVLFDRGDLRTLNLQLFPDAPLTVTGKVTSAQSGKPVANATIAFSSPSGSWETVSDAAGQFVMANLPAGIYDISAAAAGYGQTMKFHYKVTQNLNLSLSLSPEFKSRPASSADEFSVWPNPFSDQVNIHLNSSAPGSKVTLSDANGRVIWETSLNGGTTRLELGQDLPPGIYFLHFQQTDTSKPTTIRLVKAR